MDLCHSSCQTDWIDRVHEFRDGNFEGGIMTERALGTERPPLSKEGECGAIRVQGR